jgi:hypothetical protein
VVSFQILKNIKVTFNAIKTSQYSQRHIATDFTRIVSAFVLAFFHRCKCKKYYIPNAILLKKIIKIYNPKKPQELIHFQRID